MPNIVYIFLDEGGNFDFSPTGTKYFTLASLVKVRPFTTDTGLSKLKFDLLEQGNDIEVFHASEDMQRVRNQVFEVLLPVLQTSRLDTMIVEKRKTGPALQVEERFYPEMIGYLLKYVIPRIPRFDEIIVITDSIPITRKREAIRKAVKQALSKMLPRGTKHTIFHHASKSCFPLQAADYCNWAIFRKWESGDVRSYDLIREHVKSEFDLFRTGTRFYY